MDVATKIDMIRTVANEGFWQFRRYSGRGMFGAECPAIVCEPREVNQVVIASHEAGIPGEPRQDNMGLDVILYWPTILYPADQPAV